MLGVARDANNTRRFDVANRIGSIVWQPYAVPQDAVALFILAVGGGGCGGAGFQRAAGNPGGGGGGGGSGAITRMLLRTASIPKTLYINVGAGGNNTQNGAATYVELAGGVSDIAFRLMEARGGAAGGAGTAAAVGAAGAAAAASNVGAFTMIGPSVVTGGQGGSAGGAVAGGNGVSILWNAIVCGGAGGGGSTSADFNGGSSNGAGLVPTVSGGVSGSLDGKPGYELWLPPTFSGGSGGRASNSSIAGDGGKGGRGCGGGGGGAGTTAGIGGDGGDGFVLITVIY